jgi:hypothetical protein
MRRGKGTKKIVPSSLPIRYSEDIRAEDTEKALETVTVSLFPNEASPKAVDFQGTCPRCGDPIQIRQWLIVVAGALKMNDKQLEALASKLDELGVDRSRGDETFDLTCSCESAHPQRPKEKHGCGSRFRVRVTWP